MEKERRKRGRKSKSHKAMFFKLWVVIHQQSQSTFIKKTKMNGRENIREHRT